MIVQPIAEISRPNDPILGKSDIIKGRDGSRPPLPELKATASPNIKWVVAMVKLRLYVEAKPIRNTLYEYGKSSINTQNVRKIDYHILRTNLDVSHS